MKREEFLNALEKELMTLDTHERCCALEFYEELISDGNENGADEEALIAGFGTPKEIAAQILADSLNGPTAEETKAAEAAETAGEGGLAVPPRDGFAADGAIHAIVIDTGNTAVELRPVATGPVQVHFNPSQHDKISVSEENGVYTFYHRIHFSPFTLGWFPAFGPRRIVVDVPEDYSGTVLVTDSNAGVTAAGLRGVTEARLETSNARVKLHDMHIDAIEVKTSNGSVDLQDLSGSSCLARTTDARISASGCEFTKRLKLRTSNAPIRLWKCDCPSMEFNTSNASVSGCLLGDARDFAIKSHTSNASNSLPERMAYPDQSRSLEIRTSNAKIDVRFVGEK